MGLFDLFRGDKGETMTPHLAFAVSMIYMMASDGEFQNEEVGHLLSVLGGESANGTISVGYNNKQLLDRAFKYAQKHSLQDFVQQAAPILTDAQKICILTNLADSLLADGKVHPSEQRMFDYILAGFGVSEQIFRPYFQVLAIKNDRSVFTNQSHPYNSPQHSVDLTKMN